MNTSAKHSLYAILNLPQPRQGEIVNLTRDDLKSSYHRALLLHHPDKAAASASSTGLGARNANSTSSRYSIDEIVHAYRVLSDTETRLQYDARLHTSRKLANSADVDGDPTGTHLGIEIFDLDDLQHNEAENSWFKACRCGSETGYRVTEQDLDRESDIGEIYIGCQGCSLFIKVLFGIASDNGDEESDIKVT